MVLYCESTVFSKKNIWVMSIWVKVIEKLLTNVTYVLKLFVRTFIIVYQSNPSTPVIQEDCDLPAEVMTFIPLLPVIPSGQLCALFIKKVNYNSSL